MTAFLALLVIAQADEIPPIYKASPHFSNAIGGATLTVGALADPITCTLGDDISYIIRINNVRNPSGVKPPKLDWPAFDINYADAIINNNSVEFRYRLRPRSVDVKEIPGVRFDYYMPEAAEEHRLRTKYTNAVRITVMEKKQAGDSGFSVPARFQSLVEDSGDVSRIPPLWAWIATPVLAAIAAGAWVAVWRHRHPQGARLARIRRNRAVRRALDTIGRDPGAAFGRYLHERFGIDAAQTTPTDAVHELQRQGVPRENLTTVLSLLRDNDAARFGGADGTGLANRAREAILALEVRL